MVCHLCTQTSLRCSTQVFEGRYYYTVYHALTRFICNVLCVYTGILIPSSCVCILVYHALTRCMCNVLCVYTGILIPSSCVTDLKVTLTKIAEQAAGIEVEDITTTNPLPT